MRKFSEGLLTLLIVCSPWLMGSNRAIFWAVNGTISAVATMLFVAAEVMSQKKEFPQWTLPGYLFALFALPVLWTLFQIVPGVPKILGNPVWLNFPDVEPRITVNPHQSELALLWWLSMGVSFVAMRVGLSRTRTRRLLHLMAVSVLIVAIFGFANGFFGWESIGFAPKVAYKDWLTGTFVNRNSAASFFVIGLSILCVSCADAYNALGAFKNATWASQVLFILNSKFVIYVVGVLILFVALILTGSRAGIITGFIAVALIALLSTPGKTTNFMNAAIAISVCSILLAFSLNTLSVRSHEAVDSSQSRVELAKQAMEAIASRPIFGYGAGTYQSVNPIFHTAGTDSEVTWNHAHNSYLEAAVDLGIPFTMGWLGVALTLFIRLHRSCLISDRSMPANKALFIIIIAEGLHALVDFSLQNQALAIYVACLLGLAIGEATKANDNC